MHIDIIETTGLGNRSYLVCEGGIAVVIDPPRDIDRVLALVDERCVLVSHVLETHLHHDYVSGGLELARTAGAAYVVPALAQASYDRLPAEDGSVLAAGPMRLHVVHTPGHTRDHVSYVLHDAMQRVRGVFTGGSMLFGGTGRTDLAGPEHTLSLAHAQYRSVRQLAGSVPADAAVFPTHGLGSFCSAWPNGGTRSTVGAQRQVNPALTRPEADFVEELLHGLGAYPAYYERMGSINAAGPPPVDLTRPRPATATELARRIATGEWVIDLRSSTSFAAGHLPGTLNFELSDDFLPYLGWLYDWGAPLTLVASSEDQVANARRQLARIGIDRLAGAAVGEPGALAGGGRVGCFPVSDFAGLAAVLAEAPERVLDVRRHDERRWGGVRGSRHIPLHELSTRIGEVPHGEVWVYCSSGSRAAIAASMLARAGRRVVLVNGPSGARQVGNADPALVSDPPFPRMAGGIGGH